MGSNFWPVEPKQRVGPFVLGMGVNEALAIVQKMGSLDAAEFSFDENHPFDTDLSLRMPSLGLQMCFDGFQQDLRLITVCLREKSAVDDDTTLQEEGHDARPAMLPPLSYGGRVFAGRQHPFLCLRDAYAVFGPTHIGDFHRGSEAAYFLRYPGLTFEFPLPEDKVDSLASRGKHPMEVPGEASPSAARVWVFAEDSTSFADPVSALPDMPEAVVVWPATGVELRGRMLRFGAMPQDVFSDFGPPEQVCVKDVDAVRIHSAAPPRSSGPDYYYNYFRLGLDVLFDGCAHLVKKVVLHTNPPTHELFSRYTRCFFQLPIEAPGGWDPGLGLAEPQPTCSPAAAAVTAKPITEDSPPSAATPAAQDSQTEQASGSQEPLPAEPEKAQESPKPEEEEADAGGEDGFQPVQAVGRKMSKKERKAAKKTKKPSAKAAQWSLVQETSPSLTVPSTSPEPSPLLSVLDSEDRGSDAEGQRGGRNEGLEELLPPPALPLDGDSADPADATAEDREGFQERVRPRGGSGGWGSDIDMLEIQGLDGTGEPSPPCGPLEPDGGGPGALEPYLVDVRWPWPKIEELLSGRAGVSCGKPLLIVGQSGHTPFGSTSFYAFPGLAFEVMQNGWVASLTVFNVPREELPSAFLHKA